MIQGRAGLISEGDEGVREKEAAGKKRGWKKWLVGDFSKRRLLLSPIKIYVCVGVLAWLFSDYLAFQPPAPSYREGNGVFHITEQNGQSIAVLALTNAAASHVVLYAHGNAEDIGLIRSSMESYRDAGFEVYALDYRGYGLSDGRPGTARAYADLDALYDNLVTQKGVDPQRIILHGRSLGAGVAAHLAVRRPIGGLIMESAFLSVFRALSQVPLFPVDKMRNNREIQRLNCPVLFIHGEADPVIGIRQGQALYQLAQEPKFSLWVPGAGHDDVLLRAGPAYWETIGAFADGLGGQRSGK